MVRTRLILGSTLIAGFVGLLCLDGLLPGGPIYHLLVGIVVVTGLLEFYELAERTGRRPLKVLPVVLAAGFVAVDLAVRVSDGRAFDGWLGYDPSGLARFYVPMGLAATAALSIVLVAHVATRDVLSWLADAPVTSLGLLYVWFLGAHTLAIHDFGVRHTLVFIATAKLGDAGAYFVGRQWGRHRLAATVSPKKTIEGALGGLVASVLIAVLLAWLLDVAGSVGFWMLFGLLVGAVAQLGDLVESALKRAANVKDSATLFPQFGGVLDMADSLLLSAPVAFWLLVLR